MVEEWIDAEERRREWGEEYTAQNTLLHDLVSHPWKRLVANH